MSDHPLSRQEWLDIMAALPREHTCRMKPVRGRRYGKLAAMISEFQCDQCGAYVKSMVDGSMPDYCPCCGAKVVGR